MKWKILGVGSPLVDILLNVDDRFLSSYVSGAKGGMEMVEPAVITDLLKKSSSSPERAPGGSAGNTVFALAKMGVPCAMFGKLGSDADGDFYKEEFTKNGGSAACFVTTELASTGNCLSMVTPDAERTMRSALGASLLLEEKDILNTDFSWFDLVYIEGYMLYSPHFDTLLKCARDAGCRIGFDLGSFEVVSSFRDKLLSSILPDYVDLLFANAEEASALLGDMPADDMALRLAELCETAVVKSGVKGSVACSGKELFRIPAYVVEHPVDTTAAGDLYAAGFICGLSKGADLQKCGSIAARISAEVVQVFGSVLPEHSWEKIFAEMKGL